MQGLKSAAATDTVEPGLEFEKPKDTVNPVV